MSEQHCALIWSMTHLLEKSSSARVFVIAGFHTGRCVLANFFQLAEAHNLVPDDEGIIEHSILTGKTRPWKNERGIEDTVERKQWLVVTHLKWR
jgi:EEF1A N-terminal glycine/lysine methyltransferase